MQNNTDNDLLRLWAMKGIVEEALLRGRTIADNQSTVDTKILVDLLTVISDASTKLCQIRWSDDVGLHKGVMVYKQVIRNL